jgi:hypothetical protein
MIFYFERSDTNQFKTEIDRIFQKNVFLGNIKMKVGI